MSYLPDQELIKNIKSQNDEACLRELVDRHSGIYIEMIRRYGGSGLNSTQIGDMMDEKDINIYQAALEHDDSKSKFSTYLANRTRYSCLTNKTNNKKNLKFVNFDDVEFQESCLDLNPSELSVRNEMLGEIFDLIESHEDNRVRTIFKERYFSGKNNKLKPWHEIAKISGMSVQGCIDAHNRTIKQFRNKTKHDTITF